MQILRIKSSYNATGISLGPPESSTQTASRSLQPFLTGSLDDSLTEGLADHTRSVTISGAHSAEANFSYCLRLQNVSLGPAHANGISIAAAVIAGLTTQWPN